MTEQYKEWTELEHPVWGIGGLEYDVHSLVGPATFPKKIWRKGIYSIVEPCVVTDNLWEIYDGNDIERFNTLEEAKKYADALTTEHKPSEN